MKKQILKILSGIICIFGVLIIMPVKAVKFRVETKKDLPLTHVIVLRDLSKKHKLPLSTYLFVSDQFVFSWNNHVIDIREKEILNILQNLVDEGSPFNKDYCYKLAQREKQNLILYNYLKGRFKKAGVK